MKSIEYLESGMLVKEGRYVKTYHSEWAEGLLSQALKLSGEGKHWEAYLSGKEAIKAVNIYRRTHTLNSIEGATIMHDYALKYYSHYSNILLSMVHLYIYIYIYLYTYID